MIFFQKNENELKIIDYNQLRMLFFSLKNSNVTAKYNQQLSIVFVFKKDSL